ncbi:MAG: YceI family protein [Ekhidna sp.]|nr:YceI family protein [Ekhidna sp.]
MKTHTKNACSLLAFIILLILQIQTHAQNYLIDPGHTSVQTKVNRFGVIPVVGRFNQVSGTINYDAKNLADTKANLTIKSASYSANNAGGEAAVKSIAFLDTSTYPEILFELSSLTLVDSQAVAKGFLELHGTRKEK